MKKLVHIFFALTAATTGSAAAQSGTWSAAEEYFDPEEMREAKAEAQQEMGGRSAWFVMSDRLEYRSNEGEPLLLWDGQGWYGGDINKLWVKSEGEYDIKGGAFEDAEVQALWSRSITRYFDLQAGYRHDFAPDPSRNYAVIGVQGLAPYLFELDGAVFISGHGEVSARIEAEYEFMLTQRLILQPRTELNFAAQTVAERGIGSGLTSAEVGARLRYEIKREFAPYLGVEWERSVGETADFARADGEDPGSLSFVAGLRLWF